MRTLEQDARRYVWCQSQALWLLGPPAGQWAEDLEGAVAAGQLGLVRHVTRQLAEDCAVMLALALGHERPIPTANLRAAWALERIADHELAPECRALVGGLGDDVSAADLAERAMTLQGRVRAIVGDVPDPLTPEGYFPALALTRDWMALLSVLDEEGPLPREWTRR